MPLPIEGKVVDVAQRCLRDFRTHLWRAIRADMVSYASGQGGVGNGVQPDDGQVDDA